MLFPDYRPRRLRQNEAFRRMVRETALSVDDLIFPLFVIDGTGVKNPIQSMPGHYQLSIDNLVKTANNAYELGIPAIMLFGIPKSKDPLATNAYAKNGIVQKAIKTLKNKIPELIVISDVCLCQYTDHGHCGIVNGQIIDNDATLDLLARTALSHAKAGADMVAPSDMMDGRVAEIRDILDENSLSNIPIMSYSAKYCSAFYGPFRHAADSAPKFGDRRTYQMDPSNAIEAIREVTMDIEEGADIIMIKPALPYLDIIYRIRNEIDLPVAAYNVSGEYAMIKAADKMGWIDGKKVMMETLTSIKRAGADMILTYFAIEAAKELNKMNIEHRTSNIEF
ncbi:MAG: porphobilinogen synthase [Desulfobacterales bacterium]|nr:porphobilinogen synthase [Desulfobacterales bacterium]